MASGNGVSLRLSSALLIDRDAPIYVRYGKIARGSVNGTVVWLFVGVVQCCDGGHAAVRVLNDAFDRRSS